MFLKYDTLVQNTFNLILLKMVLNTITLNSFNSTVILNTRRNYVLTYLITFVNYIVICLRILLK